MAGIGWLLPLVMSFMPSIEDDNDMDVSRLAALFLFLFPLAYSPGPGNAFFASVGAGQGLRGAWPSLAGYHVATFVVTLLIGLGLDATVLVDPHFMLVLNIGGGLYVIWIGIAFLKAAGKLSSDNHPERVERPVGFKEGAVVLLLNPKAYTIIGLLFTQFLVAGNDGAAQVLAITTIFTLNNLIAFIVWTLAGVAISATLRGEMAHRRLNIGFGCCLVGVGIWMSLPSLLSVM